jgi:hypothetical protein
MRKITGIAPRRMSRLKKGFTTRTENGWTIVTATNSGTEVFRSSRQQWADYVVATITGQNAA